MALKLADAFVAITAQTQGLDRELKQQEGKVRGWVSNIGQGISQGLGQAIFSSVTGTIRNLTQTAMREVSASVSAASNLNESINKTTVAFGDSAKGILEWSKTSATAFGQSRQQALEAASSFGLLFSTMGLTREESASMSKTMVELASDLASINNATPEEALTKLRAGIVGEIEPLRVWGVLLDAATVEQKALQLGLAGTADELSQQDKVLARYQLILEQTTLQQGDFAATSKDLANAQRILAAQVEDTRAEIGKSLLPIQLAFTRGLSELITVIRPYGENIMRSLIGGIADGITYLLPILGELRKVFVTLLKPGSPPKLLPELTDWGKAAMQEYLRGWTLADMETLRSLGPVIENVLRSFVGTGETKETDLVTRIFGAQRAMTNAVREFRTLGQVSEGTLSSIAEAAGPAGTEVAELVRQYFELQRASQKVADAQADLNAVTERYARALEPINDQLDAVRSKQQEIRENQRLEEIGEILRDPRADSDEKRLARLEAEEIQLERQARAIEGERDAAVEAATDKLDAAKNEESAQKDKLSVVEESLQQQTRTNALIEEEIRLRERLANEVLAAQEAAMRELEKQQREAEQLEKERLRVLEEIADAQLQWRLASTDTAGQLALMQAELAKTTEGSAEYYRILTDIIRLEEQLKRERGTDEEKKPPLERAAEGAEELGEKWPEVERAAKALQEFFDTLKGEANEPETLTWGQGLLDFLQNAGRFAGETKRIIGELWAILFPKPGEEGGFIPSETDPFEGNWWLEGIVPFMEGAVLTLQQILDRDWGPLWQRFKDWVDKTITTSSDVQTINVYTWIRDTLIPALEDIYNTDWTRVWDSFQTTIETVWGGIATFVQEKAQAAVDAIQALLDIITPDEAIEKFMQRWGLGPETSPFAPPLHEDTLKKWREGVVPNPPSFEQWKQQQESGLPGFTPQSFTPESPVNIFIEQHISTTGDFGGARAGAQEGIRQALIDRRLNGI